MFYIVYFLEKIIEMTYEIQYTLNINLFWNLPIANWTYYMADIQTPLVNEILGFVELLFSWVRQLKAINLNKNCIVHSKMMSTMGTKKN